MSLVYEDENKQVCVVLTKNDYIKITTFENRDKFLIIKNVDGKLVIDDLDDGKEK